MIKIIIKRNEQQVEHTIDMTDCDYPYAIREALELALQLEGYSEEVIKEVFEMQKDKK